MFYQFNLGKKIHVVFDTQQFGFSKDNYVDGYSIQFLWFDIDIFLNKSY